MTSTHLQDQARAAAAHGDEFRRAAAAAGRFLFDVQGPVATAAIAWMRAPKTRCEHLPADANPQPLFGSLAHAGVMVCLSCSPILCLAMPPTCAGCGADLDPDDLPNRDVVIGLDNFVTLIGVCCPDCRAQCEPS